MSLLSLDASMRGRETTSVSMRLAHVTSILGAVALAADVTLVFASVIWRYALHDPLDWAEEVARALMITLVFCGAATAMARGKHLGVDFFQDRLPAAVRPYVRQGVLWIMVVVSAGLLFGSVGLLFQSFNQLTPTGLPQAIYVGPVLLGAAVMLVGAIEQALAGDRAVVWRTGVTALVLACALLAWTRFWPANPPPAGALMIGCFVLGILAGVPIAFTLALSSLIYFVSDPGMPLMIYAQQIGAGVDHFVLLAIPFFLLAGAAMEVNGMSSRLVELIVRGMGHWRGGLNLALVTAMAFFSGISGSKLADVAAVGGVLMPAVRRSKQDENEAAALLAASAVMAETIPPCVNMIIMGFVANLSIGALFIAGLAPAAILAIGLCVVGVVYGGRVDLSQAYPERTSTRQLLLGASVGIVMVLMIGKGVVSGIATSTEISAFAVVYALVVGWASFRELTWKAVGKLFIETATLAGTLLFIVAAASSVAFALTIELIPQRLAELLIHVGQANGTWVFFVLSIVLLVVFGAVLEGAPALIIFGPILVPIARQLGIDPIHYASVLIIAMGLGLFAPPIGLGLYATCAVCDVQMRNVIGPMRKYLLVLVLSLVLIALVPALTLWLPRSFGY